jgi:hypothetical protein
VRASDLAKLAGDIQQFMEVRRVSHINHINQSINQLMSLKWDRPSWCGPPNFRSDR